MTVHNRDSRPTAVRDYTGPAASVGIAGGVGALVACCVVQLLIVAGVLAGLGGAAIGGIALATGLVAAALVWLAALLLRRQRARSACRTPVQKTSDHDREPIR